MIVTHKIKIFVLSLVLMALSASCTRDFVEVDPPFAVTSDSFFQSEEDFQNAIIGVYDVLQATYVNVILGEIASGDIHAGGENANDVVGWQQVDRMIHTPINSNIHDVWNFNFAGVSRASFIIQNEDNVDFEGKEEIVAEARFLRAYFNFELLKWFGPIPIKPEGMFELGDETTLPRASEGEVYDYIEEDLKSAIEGLNTTPAELGRATVYSAKALLGKVYLYQENFEKSADQLLDVIDSGNFHLYGTEGDEKYEDLFEYKAENSPESVFEIQYTGVEGAGFDCLQCSSGNVMVGFSGIRGYKGPIFESGYGFGLPTEDIYNAFSEDDRRRDVSILNIEAWVEETNGEAAYSIGNQDSDTGHTGFYNRKYLPRINDNKGDANLTQPNNYRAIRYADVLLMAAEALNRAGKDNARAQALVNEVRNRAGLENMSLSGKDLLNEIYKQRRLELVGEGHHFFDAVRTGRAEDEIKGFTSPKNNVFPIPLEEIQFSQGAWEQNPGY